MERRKPEGAQEGMGARGDRNAEGERERGGTGSGTRGNRNGTGKRNIL
jgi:hypothetical protein